MGAKQSIWKQQKHRQPAICEEDDQAEEERQLLEILPYGTDWRGRTSLHRVVETGDRIGVQRLLAEGASVDATDNSGRTPLIVAASKGNAWLCELLINAGANVGARDHFGRTALHAAAMVEGGALVVELLLQQNTDPHMRDSCGRTALHCALQSGNQSSAEVLVPVMGPQLQREDTGSMELHWAAGKKTPQLMRHPMAGTSSGGAERDDDVGVTPLAQELHACNSEAVGVLVGEPCEPSDASGKTVLHWAAYAGYSTVVHQLLERGFSPWVKDHCGRDALVWAVESGVSTVVQQIVQKAGYRMCVDRKGQTALHVAAIRGDAAVAELLLASGANAAHRDSKGRTPLVYALRAPHMGVACLLATRGPATVHERDRRNRTLLHWAAVGNDVIAVRKLLARGADVNALDSEHKTPAALAVERGHEDAAALLVGADGFRVTRDRQGRTPLHGAAAAGWSKVALQLVSLGADPHECGREMLSPVQLATRAGHQQLAWDISRAGCH